MFAGSLVLGVSLVAVAIWLQWQESFGWSEESLTSRTDVEYLVRRNRSRFRIHIMIGACGILTIIAAFAGAGSPVWVGSWMIVMAALVVIVGLALLDAWRTYRYQLAKRVELRSDTTASDR